MRNPNHPQLFGPGVIGGHEHGFSLNHFDFSFRRWLTAFRFRLTAFGSCRSPLAVRPTPIDFPSTLNTIQRLVFEIGRLSSIVTDLPTTAEASSTCAR